MQNYFKELNKFYRETPALFEKQFSEEGFEWISFEDTENCVISYIRKGNDPKKNVVVVCNFTPAIIEKYKIGVPSKGKLKEVFNSDSVKFGGSGISNKRQITSKKELWNGKPYAAEITLPPLGIVIFELK